MTASLEPRRLPRGIRNNNPGNIRRDPQQWLGEVDGDDQAFEVFGSPVYGIRALARILLNYQRRRELRTVSAIIGRWAPPNENDTHAYEQAVARALDVEVDDVLDLEDRHTLAALVRAIVHHENGMQPYDQQTIDMGILMALTP